MCAKLELQVLKVSRFSISWFVLAANVLFYAESEGMVTTGHVTKMVVTPYDPPFAKTPCYTQSSRLNLLQNRSYC